MTKSVAKILLLASVAFVSCKSTDSGFCEKIRITSTSLSIDTVLCPITIEKDGVFYDTLYWDKKCHENYIELSRTQRNNWNYLIDDYIYANENGSFRQICKFTTESTRQYYALFGVPGSGKLLEEFCIDTCYDKNELLLTETTDIQTNEKTKSYYEKILSTNRNNTKVLLMLAIVFILGKESITPDNVAIINELANCLCENKCYQYSIQLLQKVLMKFPEDTAANLGLADNYWMTGNHKLAKTYYENYVSLMTAQDNTTNIPPRVLKRIR
ncbi:MAG: tetratricopeptide repeat protein [Bacteroidales bacterium]|nr:tetratricopeptide repeat protein [Bacteroidales bacterium]